MSNYDQELKDLKKQFPNKRALTLKETAQTLNVSVNTLRRGVKIGRGIPSYKKIGSGELRTKVVFPIIEIAKYLSDVEKVY